VKYYSKVVALAFAVSWLVLFILFCALTPKLWCDAQSPSELPWSNRMTSLVINTLTTMPLIGFFSFSTLAVAVRDMGKKKKFPDGTIEYNCFRCVRMYTPAMVAFLMYGYVFGSLVVGLFVYSFVLWLPSFLVDLALHNAVSVSTITTLNTLLQLAICYILFKKVPLWTAQYEKAKEREEELKLKQLQQHEHHEHDEKKELVDKQSSKSELGVHIEIK